MTFVSYAQNFEDVMLWRALKHIEKGFYIDVGANDPDVYSVTKAFYEQGWRGINIEPVSQWFEKIQQRRTRDINLNIAAGAREEVIIFYEIPNTGLSTSKKEIAERHKQDHGYGFFENRVPVKTLTQICQTYHEGPIHFLNIDVEGTERDVLQGLNLTDLRPWIILVESTLPNTQVENHEKWEALLTNSDYDFVYFDGVNRFYVARERVELKAAFNAPPNFFDDFIKSEQLYSENRAQQAEETAKHLELELTDAKNQIAELHESLSWQITWPLRILLDGIKWIFKMSISAVKRIL